MKTLKLSTLVLALVFGAWLGCGGSSGGGTGGSMGTGGAVGMGGVGLSDGGGALGGTVYDAPISGSETGSEAGGQGGASGGGACGASGYVDCTALTPAQCHDLIINPPTIPDCILPQDPSGAPPDKPYPSCSAI
jgi:hypothetical protein